jgi:hypothetical protein
MRRVMLALSLAALTGLFACNGEDENLKKELMDAKAKVESLQNDLSSKETDLDQAVVENRALTTELTEVKRSKELGAVEISNLNWQEKDADFKLILTGTVKNTGNAFLRDVTVKVAIKDETDNIIEVKIVNDPDREKMSMLFFQNVADALNKGSSKDFELVIYTRNIHASGLGKVKEAIHAPGGPRVEITGLFVSAR